MYDGALAELKEYVHMGQADEEVLKLKQFNTLRADPVIWWQSTKRWLRISQEVFQQPPKHSPSATAACFPKISTMTSGTSTSAAF